MLTYTQLNLFYPEHRSREKGYQALLILGRAWGRGYTRASFDRLIYRLLKSQILFDVGR